MPCEVQDYTTREDLNGKINYLTACLCAILTELEKRPICTDIIAAATTNGKVDVASFWKLHQSDDVKRVKNMLFSTFSQHEIDLIKKLTQEGKI